ncbi:MAG: LysR substrate-binding domain-containing protein, partial [Rhizobiaceae bacterium]
SPDYVKKHGEPRGGDFAGHACLLLRFPGADEFFWTLQVNGKNRRYDPKSPLESDDGDVLTHWALQGCGIVNKTRFEVADHLASGELVEIARDTPPTPLPFSCVFPHKRLQDPKTRFLIDHMVQGCREILS